MTSDQFELGVLKPWVVLQTDDKPVYRTYVRRVLPAAFHDARQRKELERQPKKQEWRYVHMWWVNQACASIRHDLSRMRRKTCVTTKDLHGLRQHLWLYVAHRNGYQRDLFVLSAQEGYVTKIA